MLKYRLNLILLLGAFALILMETNFGCSQEPPLLPTAVVSKPLPVVLNLETIATLPHDPKAYTQGLVFENGFLYESTGQYGESTLRKVDPKTGAVLMKVSLPQRFFAEGMQIIDDQIYQLTWREGFCFVFDKNTFEKKDQFRYSGEGWGLAYDGENLLLSDGSPTIRFMDPKTFKQRGKISVSFRDPKTKRTSPVANLNELEYIHGEIWANVWLSPKIVRINPKTGDVIGWIDFTGFIPEQFKRDHFGQPSEQGGSVLNGIAFDPATNRIFITGKNWPVLFELKIKE